MEEIRAAADAADAEEEEEENRLKKENTSDVKEI